MLHMHFSSTCISLLTDITLSNELRVHLPHILPHMTSIPSGVWVLSQLHCVPQQSYVQTSFEYNVLQLVLLVSRYTVKPWAFVQLLVLVSSSDFPESILTTQIQWSSKDASYRMWCLHGQSHVHILASDSSCLHFELQFSTTVVISHHLLRISWGTHKSNGYYTPLLQMLRINQGSIFPTHFTH